MAKNLYTIYHPCDCNPHDYYYKEGYKESCEYNNEDKNNPVTLLSTYFMSINNDKEDVLEPLMRYITRNCGKKSGEKKYVYSDDLKKMFNKKQRKIICNFLRKIREHYNSGSYFVFKRKDDDVFYVRSHDLDGRPDHEDYNMVSIKIK